MQVTITSTTITFSSDGTNADKVYERTAIASVRSVAIPGVAGYNPSMPANKQAAFKVEIMDTGGEKFMFDIQDVTNQPTWTANQSGLNNAVAAIKQ